MLASSLKPITSASAGSADERTADVRAPLRGMGNAGSDKAQAETIHGPCHRARVHVQPIRQADQQTSHGPIRLASRSDLEALLRGAGLSRSAARKVAAGGWPALAKDERDPLDPSRLTECFDRAIDALVELKERTHDDPSRS